MRTAEATTTEKPAKRRSPPAIRYPSYALADSVAAAEAIHKRGGGVATRDQLAAFLGYKTTNSGAFLTRLASARLFDLITTRDKNFVVTPLAQRILMPVYEAQPKEALVEAFLKVPLFKAIFEELHGRELPPDFGFKNMLVTQYGLGPAQAAEAHRALMESADTAGFFLTRGKRTHLIMPQFQTPPPPAPAEREEGEVEGERSFGDRGRGGGGTTPPPTRPQNREELQNIFIAAMIEVWREKERKGESDPELRGRIEQLLALPE